MKLNKSHHEILSYIASGKLRTYLTSKVSDKQSRLDYYKRIDHLKALGIVIEFHGELTINTSHKYYKFQNYKISDNE